MASPTLHKDQMESHASYTRDHTHIGVIRVRDVKLCEPAREGQQPVCAVQEFEIENILATAPFYIV